MIYEYVFVCMCVLASYFCNCYVLNYVKNFDTSNVVCVCVFLINIKIYNIKITEMMTINTHVYENSQSVPEDIAVSLTNNGLNTSVIYLALGSRTGQQKRLTLPEG